MGPKIKGDIEIQILRILQPGATDTASQNRDEDNFTFFLVCVAQHLLVGGDGNASIHLEFIHFFKFLLLKFYTYK